MQTINTIINTQYIHQFLQQITQIKTKLDESSIPMSEFVAHVQKQPQFNPKENETIEEEYKRKESMFDVVLKVIEEREKVTTTGNQMINELNKVIETIKQIIKEGENSKTKLKVINFI